MASPPTGEQDKPRLMGTRGAYLVACADQNLYDLDPHALSPDAIRAVVWPWLRQRTGR